MAASYSALLRVRSVSSRRRMKVPPCRLANSQLNSAARTFPTCNNPVGLGAKRTTGAAGGGPGGDLWRGGGGGGRPRPAPCPGGGGNAHRDTHELADLAG